MKLAILYIYIFSFPDRYKTLMQTLTQMQATMRSMHEEHKYQKKDFKPLMSIEECNDAARVSEMVGKTLTFPLNLSCPIIDIPVQLRCFF